MAKRRKDYSEWNDAIRGFGMGYSIGNQYQEDQALKAVANDKPEAVTEASGSDALSSAQAGMRDAMIANPDKAEEIKKVYEPTLKALESQKDKPAGLHYSMGSGDNFTQFDHAPTQSEQMGLKVAQQADIIGRRNPLKAQQLRQSAMQTEESGLKLDELRQAAGDAKSRREVDGELKSYVEQNAQKDADGKPVLNDNTMINALTMRSAGFLKRGLFDDALKNDETRLKFVSAKVAAETAERTRAAGAAKSMALQGDMSGIAKFYDRYIYDGTRISGMTPNKDGTVTVNRVGIDGHKFNPYTVSNDALIAGMDSLTDPKAASEFIDRSFKRQIEERKLENDNKRTAASVNASNANARLDNLRADGVGMELVGNEARGRRAADPTAKLTPDQERGLNYTTGKAATETKAGGYKVEAGEVQNALGRPAVDGEGNPVVDPMTGRQVVNRDLGLENEFWQFMDKSGLKDTNEALFKFKSMKASGGAAPAKAAPGWGARRVN